MKKFFVCALLLVLLSGCSISGYRPTMDYEIHQSCEEREALLDYIAKKNILLFDLSADGIGVHGNGVFLPSCIPASNVTCMAILQMLPYAEFVPLDGIFVDPNKVSGSPVLLIELRDIDGNQIGLIATHSRISGLEGKECLVISPTEESHIELRDIAGNRIG